MARIVHVCNVHTRNTGIDEFLVTRTRTMILDCLVSLLSSIHLVIISVIFRPVMTFYSCPLTSWWICIEYLCRSAVDVTCGAMLKWETERSTPKDQGHSMSVLVVDCNWRLKRRSSNPVYIVLNGMHCVSHEMCRPVHGWWIYRLAGHDADRQVHGVAVDNCILYSL